MQRTEARTDTVQQRHAAMTARSCVQQTLRRLPLGGIQVAV
ncbi:hypothetical protein K788_0008510 [Paraburkholderia caribensis MBA4]|uniref:Uncharacterized protein n=1 Tax=Paraburkholderia caribensis MBA4 TaxID=1323664 RepID=A0A0P0REV5_9BURK|nr:hypothetical protein K788_0008510 [Paraburkholderia caribensis MBA4]